MKYTQIYFLIFFSQTLQIKHDKKYLNKNDVLIIKIEDFLESNSLIDDIEIFQSNKKITVKIDQPTKYIQLSPSIELNKSLQNSKINSLDITDEEKELMKQIRNKSGIFEITKIYSQNDYKNWVVLFVDLLTEKNVFMIGNLISSLSQNQFQASTKLYKASLNNDSFQCGKIMMDDQFIYAPCISRDNGNFHICKQGYLQENRNFLATCKMYEIDYKMSIEEIEMANLKMAFYQNQNKENISILYLVRSMIPHFQNSFVLITPDKYLKLTIPVENFIIDKIEIHSYIAQTNLISIFCSNQIDNTVDLFHFKIQNLQFDPFYISDGLIKTNLKSWDFVGSSLMMYQENQATYVLTAIEINLIYKTESYYNLEDQSKLFRSDLGHNIVFLETLTSTNQKKYYVYEIQSQKFFNLKITLDDRHWWFLVTIDNLNLLVIFKYIGEIYDFDGYIILPVQNVTIKNEAEEYGKREIVTFYVKKKPIYTIELYYGDYDQTIENYSINYFSNQQEEIFYNIDIYGNNLDYIGENLDFFQQVKFQSENNVLNNCRSKFEILDSEVFTRICENNDVIFFYSYSFGIDYYQLDEPYLYRSINFPEGKIIDGTNYYGAALIIFLDKGEKIFYAFTPNSYENKDLELYFKQIQFLHPPKGCIKNIQGISCEYEKKQINYNFQFTSNSVTLEIISESLIEEYLGIKLIPRNSSYSSSEQTFFIKDKFFTNYMIRQCENELCNNIYEFPEIINKKIQYQMVSYQHYVIIEEEKETFNYFSIFNKSILNYPSKYYQNFKTYKGILYDDKENYFVILFEDKNNILKGILNKGTYDLRNRIIKVFDIGKNCEPLIKQMVNLEEQMIILIKCENEEEYRVFKYNIDGPLIKKKKNSAQILFQIKKENILVQKQYLINSSLQEKQNEQINQKIDLKTWRIQGDISKSLKFDLETNQILNIKGSYYKCMWLRGHAQVSDRISFHNQKILLYEEKDPYVVPSKQFDGLIYKNEYLFILDYHYYNRRQLNLFIKYNFCIFLRKTYSDNSFHSFIEKPFLCRDANTFTYHVTNLETNLITLNHQKCNTKLIYEKGYLLEIQNIIYLILSFGKNVKLLQIIKIEKFESRDGKQKFKIHYVKDIYVDIYYHQLMRFTDFFPVYNVSKNQISIFLHTQFSPKIIVINFNIVKAIAQQKDTESLTFYDQLQMTLYKTVFTYENENIILFATSEQNVYEIQIYFDQIWKYKIVSVYYNKYGNTMGNEIITFSKNYLALLFEPHKSIANAVIWKRNENEKIINSFSVLTNYEIESMSYKIVGITLHYDYLRKRDKILILVYEDQIGNQNLYQKLSLKKFDLENLNVTMDIGMLNFRDELVLRLYRDPYNFQDIVINIILEEKAKIYFLKLVMFFVLFIIFLFIVLLIISEITNKKLQKNLEIWRAVLQKEKIEQSEESNEIISKNSEEIVSKKSK